MPSSYTLPPRTISEDKLISVDSTQENRRRTYFCIAITDWSGELVMTSYLRAKKGKSHLFMEVSHFILPPLKTKYYDLDSTDPNLKYKWMLGHFIGAIIASPFLLTLSPITVFAFIMRQLQHWPALRQVRKAIRDNPVFNYGALTSIRQLGSENKFQNLFSTA